jgi:transcriptional regulator with XRE-family HTH domain
MSSGLTCLEDPRTVEDMTPDQMRALRHQLGWTLRKMAEELGLGFREQVSRMERGQQLIPGPVAILLGQLQAEADRQAKRGQSSYRVDPRGGPGRKKKDKESS